MRIVVSEHKAGMSEQCQVKYEKHQPNQLNSANVYFLCFALSNANQHPRTHARTHACARSQNKFSIFIKCGRWQAPNRKPSNTDENHLHSSTNHSKSIMKKHLAESVLFAYSNSNKPLLKQTNLK